MLFWEKRKIFRAAILEFEGNQNALLIIVMGCCWWNSGSFLDPSWQSPGSLAFRQPCVVVGWICFRWNAVGISRRRSHCPVTVNCLCLSCRAVVDACWCSCRFSRLLSAIIALYQTCLRCSNIRYWFDDFCSWVKAIDWGCICARDAQGWWEF